MKYAILLLSSIALLNALTLNYYVEVVSPSATPIAVGKYVIVATNGEVASQFIPEWGFSSCPEVSCNALEILLKPAYKFINFNPQGAKYVGPGALGFPNGIIPCNKYQVEQGGIKYEVCAYKNVIVYEVHDDVNEERVLMIPNADALRLVPWITDPVSPFVKAFMLVATISISIAAVYAFSRRHEVVVT